MGRTNRFLKRKGFTLVEVLVTIGIITALTGLSLVLIDPVRQFAKSRNVQRVTHVEQILNAVAQNAFDNRGTFSCASALPTSSRKMASGGGNYDIASCLIPTYLQTLPYDPNASGTRFVSTSDYDTGYFIIRNASTGRITVNAPSAELGETISVSR